MESVICAEYLRYHQLVTYEKQKLSANGDTGYND